MKIKDSVKMIGLLSILLISLTAGLLITKPEVNKQEDIQEIEPVKKDTYLNSIKNNDNAPQEVIDVITTYMDAYFKSISELELVDTTELFSNELISNLNKYAVSLQIDVRKLYDFDFKMDKASYDLVIESCVKDNNTYTIDILESDSFFFNFLEGVESNEYDIEVSFVIEKVDDTYKIKDINKEQDYITFFKEENPTSVEDLETIYNSYFEKLTEKIEERYELKQDALAFPYVIDKTYSKPYNRTAALEYLNMYYHSRNDDYYDFSSLGGNCQNFGSQVINYAGIDMDLTDEVWKFYSDELDESSNMAGRSSSWTSVPNFYQYVKHNKNGGIIGDVGINLFYGEVGDIIQVGYNKEYIHTTVISKVIGQHILVSANTTDCKDYPIEAYLYPHIRLIKILGSN